MPEFKEKYNTKWDASLKQIIPKDNEFNFNAIGNYFLFRISDISSFKCPFPFPVTNENENYTFKLNIVHDPLIANFWHCMLQGDFFDNNNDSKVIGSRNKSKKLIASRIKNELINISKFSLDDFVAI
ncbi:MAG: hypothetical protein IPO85_11900 [Saprospiraceae bacterium]|uniref:Uncharacterized protein n=1 Tax=Candidatus Defluviibacterium haderslevense TaxID=2981993 RepID=A0A9D7SAP8_9BACT|nr:hypothetical protein [Candidatus Defluviibacterium haderslevense]